MNTTEQNDMISIGAFTVPDSRQLLAALVAHGIEPEIADLKGIRDVGMYGNSGLTIRTEFFVPVRFEEQACRIRDQDLKLRGEV